MPTFRPTPTLMAMAIALAALQAAPPADAVQAVHPADTTLGPANWDGRRNAVIIPYAGPYPSFTVGTLNDPPRVYVDFRAAPGMLGVFSTSSGPTPLIEQWVLMHQDLNKVRLTLTFAHPMRVRISDDFAHRQIVVAPLALAKPAPRPHPTPTPRPVETPEPIPTPLPTPEATPTPRPTPTPTPRPVPTPRPTPTPVPVFIATPTPKPVPTPTWKPIPTVTFWPKHPTPQPIEWVSTPVPELEETPSPADEPTPAPMRTYAPIPVRTMAPRAIPTPQPTPVPTPVPTPEPTPEPTPRPTFEPTPAPTPEPQAAPGPGVLDALHDHRLGLRVEGWLLPGGSGFLGYGGASPAWVGSGGFLMADGWGLNARLTVFPQVYASFRTAPYFAANTPMLDLSVRHQIDVGSFFAGIGYRSLGVADVNFLTASALIRRPLPGGLFWLEGNGLVGVSPSGRQTLDADARLSLRWESWGASLGFRELAIWSNAEPPFSLNGPLLDVTYRF